MEKFTSPSAINYAKGAFLARAISQKSLVMQLLKMVKAVAKVRQH
jgi:hypothetical protein